MTVQQDTYRIAIELATSDLLAGGDALVKAAQAAKRLERSFRDVEQTVDGLDKIRRALTDLFQAMEGKASAISETTRAIQRLARVTASADATMRKATAKVRDAGEAHERLRASADRASESMASTERTAEREGQSLDGLTTGAIRAAGANQALELAKKAAELAARALTAAVNTLAGALRTWASATVQGQQAAGAYDTALRAVRQSMAEALTQTSLVADATRALELALGNAEPAGRAAAAAVDLLYSTMREAALLVAEFALGIDTASASLDDAGAAVTALATRIAQLADAMQSLRETWGPIIRSIDETSRSIIPFFRAVDSVTDAGARARVQYDGLGRVIGTVEAPMSRAGAAAAQVREALVDVSDESVITVARAAELRRQAESTAQSMWRWASEGWRPVTEASDAAASSLERTASRMSRLRTATQQATAAAEEYVFTVEEIARLDAEFARTKGQDPAEIAGIQRAAETQRKYLATELELQAERAEALAAAEAERQARAEEQARAHAERMRQTYISAASAVTDPLLELYGAGIEAAVDASAERAGVAAKRIIGDQLVAIGRSAAAAAAVVSFGDPAAGFVPNPARGAALGAAAAAAIGVGRALGGSAGGGQSGGGRGPAPATPQSAGPPGQNITNIVMNGITTDPRGTARAIVDALSTARRQGAA